MSEAIYEYRPSRLRQEERYVLMPGALTTPAGQVAIGEICRIRFFSMPGMGSLAAGGTLVAPGECCRIELLHGKSIQLSGRHFVSWGKFEDRTPAFRAFVQALIADVRATQPETPILTGMPPAIYWSWMLTFGSFTAILAICFLFAAIDFIAEHILTFANAGGLACILLIGWGPFTFLRATWRRRAKPLGPELPRLGSAF